MTASNKKCGKFAQKRLDIKPLPPIQNDNSRKRWMIWDQKTGGGEEVVWEFQTTHSLQTGMHWYQ